MLLSIIIPTYNRAVPLSQALESLLPQLREDEEILVVDDGSQDQTADLIGRYSRVRFQQAAHQGTVRARNLGMALARGRYLLPFDSDWLMLPAGLQGIRQVLDSQPLGVHFFACRSWPGGKISTPTSRVRRVTALDLLSDQVQELVPLLPLELVRQYQLQYCEDYANVGELLLPISLCQREPGWLHPLVPILYRTDVAQRTSSAPQQLRNARDMARLSEEFLRRLQELGAEQCHQDRRRLAAGVYHILAGDGRLGRHHLQRLPGWKARWLHLLSFSPPLFRALFALYRERQRIWHD